MYKLTILCKDEMQFISFRTHFIHNASYNGAIERHNLTIVRYKFMRKKSLNCEKYRCEKCFFFFTLRRKQTCIGSYIRKQTALFSIEQQAGIRTHWHPHTKIHTPKNMLRTHTDTRTWSGPLCKQTETGGAPVQLNRKWRKWAVYTELGWLRSEVNPRALPALLCDGQGKEREQVDSRMRGRDKNDMTRDR